MATAKRTAVRRTRTSVREKSKKSSSASKKARVKSTRVSDNDPHPQPLPTRGRGGARRTAATQVETPANPRISKHKGGPVRGTPSPMRMRLSPELQEHARRLFEQTAEPTTHIALDCGVNESVLRRFAEREGWVRFVAPPRGLPPVAKLLAEVEELERTARDGVGWGEVSAQSQTPLVVDVKLPPTDSRCSASAFSLESTAAEGRLRPSPPLVSLVGGGEKEETDDGHRKKRIERCTQVVMAHIETFEDTRRNGRLVPKQHLANARAISILTEAFNKLQRLRADLSGPTNHDSPYADTFSDMPADPDAFRDELARRIRAFVASRTGPRDADGGSASAAVDEVR